MGDNSSSTCQFGPEDGVDLSQGFVQRECLGPHIWADYYGGYCITEVTAKIRELGNVSFHFILKLPISFQQYYVLYLCHNTEDAGHSWGCSWCGWSAEWHLQCHISPGSEWREPGGSAHHLLWGCRTLKQCVLYWNCKMFFQLAMALCLSTDMHTWGHIYTCVELSSGFETNFSKKNTQILPRPTHSKHIFAWLICLWWMITLYALIIPLLASKASSPCRLNAEFFHKLKILRI